MSKNVLISMTLDEYADEKVKLKTEAYEEGWGAGRRDLIHLLTTYLVHSSDAPTEYSFEEPLRAKFKTITKILRDFAERTSP